MPLTVEPLDHYILPYTMTTEISLSNLTGSPDGPGFPGFPLAP